MRVAIPLLLALVVAGCSSPQVVPPVLPENILAEPAGLVGIVAAPAAVPAAGPQPTSVLATALRALGIPYRVLRHGDLDFAQLEGIALVIVEEESLADPTVPPAFARLLDNAGVSRVPLLILAQTSEKAVEGLRRSGSPIEQRPSEYDVILVAPQRDHRVLAAPNTISTDDIAAFSERTRQFATATKGRAIVAGNLDRPDASAGILRAPYGKGAVWYVAFPISDRAADGHPPYQRLLANLASIGPGD